MGDAAHHHSPGGAAAHPGYRTVSRLGLSVDERTLEQVANSSRKTALSEAGGAESGAVVARGGAVDADLAEVVEAWPALDQSDRKSILAIVRAGAE